jgi:hypothetical protein
MISLKECATRAGLNSNEIILGAVRSPRHDALLASYMLNLHRGAATVREMIVSDIRRFLDLGARDRAADALLVLRLFFSEIDGSCVRQGKLAESRKADADTAEPMRAPVVTFLRLAPQRSWSRFHTPAAVRRRSAGR